MGILSCVLLLISAATAADVTDPAGFGEHCNTAVLARIRYIVTVPTCILLTRRFS